jgi:hypothetical protein
MSPLFEGLASFAVVLFWLAPLLVVTLCVAAGGCVRVAELARRLQQGRAAAELR